MTLDEKVSYWHTHETGNTLREFLGMTEDEYAQWLVGGVKDDKAD